MFIKEHKRNLRQCLLEKSKLAQHAYGEGHQIRWSVAWVLQVEPDNIYSLLACPVMGEKVAGLHHGTA
jgi:hypothetical protein